MKVTKAEFDFTFRRLKYHAHLSMFTPAKTPMLRVWLRLRDNAAEVFVFYKTGKQELFWFDLHDEFKQGMAKAIADLLLEP